MLSGLMIYALRWLLRRLPRWMVAPLDAWSQRIARSRLERRRKARAQSAP
ncbi:MAG: hypothetical protein V4609_01480 [Pseudomonadota bacterium]